MFSFSYILSTYLKMRSDIRQRKKLEQRLEHYQSNLKRIDFKTVHNQDNHIYQLTSNIKGYEPITLTNEWIMNPNRSDEKSFSMDCDQDSDLLQNNRCFVPINTI